MTTIEKPTVCGKCGSDNLNDLARGGSTLGTIVCLSCNAKWFRKWFTVKEWDAWVNQD